MQAHLNALGRTLIIVNPVAQSGAADGAAERLKRFLSLYNHDNTFDLARTGYPRHAIELAKHAKGYDTVLALGGDGVVHEVANGLMRIEKTARPTLGVVPVGSGNDFARTLGITEITDVSGTDFAPILYCERTKIDVLKVAYEPIGIPGSEPVENTAELKTGMGNREVEYAVETVSFGLCAAIAADTQVLRKSTGLRGAPLYTASGMRCFGRGYRNFPVSVRIDDSEAQSLKIIVFAVQNGPTYGSGYHICPNADPSDGALDICYAKGPVPRTAALPVFLSAKNGRHVNSKFVRLQRAQSVDLEFAEDSYPIQLDGEIIRARNMRIEVVPDALDVLKPAQAHPIIP